MKRREMRIIRTFHFRDEIFYSFLVFVSEEWLGLDRETPIQALQAFTGYTYNQNNFSYNY
jgi:hypothetical protein